MKPQPSQNPCLIKLPGGAETMRAFGDELTILLGPEETGGTFTLFITVTEPGGGPPPHYHVNEDECFYVLEGRAEFFKDGRWTEVPAGTTVYIPKGAVHSFRNAGDTPLRQLIRTSPSGFERFFAAMSAELAKSKTPDMQRVVAIAAEYGIYFV